MHAWACHTYSIQTYEFNQSARPDGWMDVRMYVRVHVCMYVC